MRVEKEGNESWKCAASESRDTRAMEDAEVRKPRLMIREMVLENFKSYAGKQRIGPFHKVRHGRKRGEKKLGKTRGGSWSDRLTSRLHPDECHQSFSSVVGPNGSGKSNVIDAMLFVFGYRANKLRQGNVSELIHNSSNHPDLEEATVYVHFQEILDTVGCGRLPVAGSLSQLRHDENADLSLMLYFQDGEGYEVVPGSEFVISRTARKDNTSTYYINGRPAKKKSDVTGMLKGKGIDLDNNRFLILQGEVEQISMMKPKAVTPHDEGLLEYLEDIIGTNQYVEQIEEGEKQLEELNAKRQQTLNKVNIVEKEREGLEGAKAEAEAYTEKEIEKYHWNQIMYQLLSLSKNKELEELSHSKLELEEKLKADKEEFGKLESGLKEKKKAFEATKKNYAEIETEVEAVEKDLKGFERKDTKYREDIKHKRQKVKKAKEKMNTLQKKLVDCKEDTATCTKSIPESEERAEKLQISLRREEEVLQNMLDGLKEEIEAKTVQLQEARKELAPWETQINQKQAKLDVHLSEKKLIDDKFENAKRKLQDAQEAAKEAEAAFKQKEKQIKECETERANQKMVVQQCQEKVKSCKEEENTLDQSLRTIKGRVMERRHAVQAEKSRGALVKSLMEAKANGTIRGIHGRLGDLGAVPERFDIAASTAAAALDYIVVDTTEAAQKCVQLLRKRNLGVATFLILEKQKQLEQKMREPVMPPEGIPRLFDLVRVNDDRIKVAFYYAFRDTLCAHDLDQASRIAYGADKRWRRIVTLEGQLIESSGTMSGGGSKPRSGRMRLGTIAPQKPNVSTVEGTLEEEEANLQASTKRLESVKKGALTASQNLAKAEDALSKLELQIPKLYMEVEAEKAKSIDFQGRLAELEKSATLSEQDTSRLSELAKEISHAEKEINALKAECSGLFKRVEVLEDEIQNAGGEILKSQKRTVERMKQGISESTDACAKMRAQISANEKLVTRLEKDTTKAEEELVSLQKELENLEGEWKGLEQEALKVNECLEESRALLETKAADLATVKEEYEAAQKSSRALKEVEADINIKLGELKDKSSKLEREIISITKQLEKTSEQWQNATGNAEKPPLLSAEELSEHDLESVQLKVSMVEGALQQMKPDMTAIEEWKRKNEVYEERVAELASVTGERDKFRRSHEELRKKRLDEFMSGFNIISLKLKEMYQMITLGGDAELELVDSLDPFSEGIVFSVRPPKKSWKNIANLSGGEKTLSSLALVFALHHFKPTPLYVMDEIDAALDFKNVSIVANYIKERTKDAQFIIISLRNNMFELADRLVGIYKTDNSTKSVTINPQLCQVGAT